MRSSVPALMALLLLASGCAGDPSPGPKAVADDDLPRSTVRGLVTDEALVPIARVNVTLPELDRRAVTDDAGRFAFVAIPSGTWTLEAAAKGYKPFAKSIEVIEPQPLDVKLELVAIAAPDLSYYTTAVKSGRIFCGADWRIDAAAPQGPLAACGALYATPANDIDSFAVSFDISSNNVSAVRELVFETQWTPTQTFGTGLRVFWEAYQLITPAYEFTEDLRTFTHVEGASPLRGMVDHIDILDNVTGKRPTPEFCVPNGPCKFWARVFPHAGTLGPDSPVDVSTYVDQSYTHYVTEFYGERSRPGFTALDA